MLQLVTFEHVAVQPGFAPHVTSQLAPPLQLHSEPAQTQLAPVQLGTAWLPQAIAAAAPTEIDNKNGPIHAGRLRTRRDSSNPPSSRRA